MQQLQQGTTLQGGKYRIERLLGHGGFGNTYVAYNTTFEERVAIKEFFMQGVNTRNDNTGFVSVSLAENVQQFEEQKEKFKKEALRIRKLNNPHIIKVHDLFEENGTIYYVMDYVDGENLAEVLKRKGKAMYEQEVLEILLQVLDALKAVHDAKIWHLDLKPANIMIDNSGKVTLIDFGASKQLNAQKGGATTSTAISYTNGYAPREQMEQNYNKFGPWTDFYALGATLYTLLSNKRPPLPTDLDDDVSEDKHVALPVPSYVSGSATHQLMLWMMSTNRNHRPKDVREITGRMNSIAYDVSKTVFNNDESEMDYDEYTIIASPNEDKQDERVANISCNENKDVGKDSHVVKTLTKDVQPKEQIIESPSKSSDEKSNERILKVVFLSVITFFAVCIVISLLLQDCSQFESNSDYLPVDCTDVSYIAVDTTPFDDNYVKDYIYNSPLGKCKYTGYVNGERIPDCDICEVRFNDGRYYKGPIRNGVFTGENVYFVYPNGDIFWGSFKNNSFYEGKYMIAKDGSYFKGTFKKGQPDKGTWYDKNGGVIQQVR